MHMHLYVGIAGIVNYGLNHFSGTRGMSPSETFCCSALSPIIPGIWPTVSSFTQGKKNKNLCFLSLVKPITITILTDPHMELKSKTQHQCFSPFFKGLLLPYLMDLAINYFQWYVRVRKEGGSFVYV